MDLDFKHTTDAIYSNKLYVGVKKENTDLLAVINKGFQTISAEELEAIKQKWLGISIIMNTADWPASADLNGLNGSQKRPVDMPP